ncbi:MAG: endonuclease/exonuclease/phosphatase family protein [Blastocatellia bacterium]
MKPTTLSSAIKDLAFSLLKKLPSAAFLYVPALTLTAFCGDVYWWFELTTHFRLQYFVSSAIFLAIFALLKMRRWAGIALVCLAINAAFVLPWYLPSSNSAQTGDGQKLRLLLSNVLWENTEHAKLIEEVRREKPDIAFFQEVTPRWAEELKALSGEYPEYRLYPTDDAGGIAAFSRIPFVRAEAAPMMEHNGPAIIAQINVGAQLVSIVSVHAPPPGGKKNFDHRTEVFDQTAEFLNSLPEPKLVIGDLNTTMWSPYYKRFVAKTGLVNVREGFGILPSWSTYWWPMVIPIDHCLVSRGIQVVNVRIGAPVGSDHLPLIVDLIIPQS